MFLKIAVMKKILPIMFVFLCIGFISQLHAQNVVIGTDGTNNTTFESDGTMVFNGEATVFDDIMVYPDATTRGGSNQPVWGGSGANYFKNNGSGSQGVFLWMFDKETEEELYFCTQIPHSYKIGTPLYPHVHWTTRSGTPSGTNVVWGLEYTVVAIGGSFGNTTILTANSLIPGITPSGTGQHLITPLGTIPSTGLGISTILVCRVFRAAANGSDTFDNETGLLGIDFHFQKDTEGSRSEYSK
jgi:hypothetical protein